MTCHKQQERQSKQNAINHLCERPYCGDNPLGRLMHDFFCDRPEDMHYKILADRMQFVKNNEKGVKTMCRIIEEYAKEEAAIAEKRGEKRGKEKEKETRLLRVMATKKFTLKELAEMFEMSLKKVTALGQAHGLV